LAASGAALETQGEEWLREYVFGEGFVGFDGHFPGQPVLPAMVQLMAGAQCAGDAAGEALRPVGVARAKFLRPILPGEKMRVRVRLSPKGSDIVAIVSIDVCGEAAATFQLTLTR